MEDRETLGILHQYLVSAMEYGLTAEVVYFAMEEYRRQDTPDMVKAMDYALREWDL